MTHGSSAVKEFYNKYPFPSRGLLFGYKIAKHADKVIKASGKKAKDFAGLKVLEIGCGTGEIGCSLAFNGTIVTGVDFCGESIRRAKLLAKKHNLKKIKFIESDLFELPEKLKEKFDLVSIIGVAHHTRAPKKAFQVATRFLKENGIVLLGLYNETARKETTNKRRELEKKAGSDLNKKMKLVAEDFGRKPNEAEEIYLADKYCHPLEKTVSLSRALNWFEVEGLELVGCDPKMPGSVKESEREWAKLNRSFFILAGKKKMEKFFVYLAECRDGSFYCGWTNDLKKRIKAHNQGKGAKYTKRRRPVRIVFSEQCENKSEAMKLENRIKGLTRKEKEALVSRAHQGNSCF